MNLGPLFTSRLTLDKWALVAFAFVLAIVLFGGA